MKDIEANNKEIFAATIRKLARVNKLTVFDALVSYCEDHDLSMDDVIPVLDKNLKEELRTCAIQSRMIRGQKPKPTLF